MAPDKFSSLLEDMADENLSSVALAVANTLFAQLYCSFVLYANSTSNNNV